MGVVTGQFFSKFGVDVSLKILHRWVLQNVKA